MDLDPRSLRNAFGCFATGITVITTVDAEGALYGVTANSFASLSLDPPLVLFCLDYKSMSFEAFRAGTHFAVNILREDQQALSAHFARSNADKWANLSFDTWDTGCPILPESVASMECEIASIHEGGDHIIIVGRVLRADHDESAASPLIFYRGRYQGLGQSE